MGSRDCNRWTFWGLVAAFVELALAYCLLCGSAFVFLASRFLLAFDLYLPCPCSGILGYKNTEICFHKLLFEWPLRKIYAIQKLGRSSLPYGIVWHQDQEEIPSSAMVNSADGKHRNSLLKMGYRKGSSSASGLRIESLGDKESGSEFRTRQSMNQKQKVAGRRRRAKSSSVFLRGNAQLGLGNASGSANSTRVMKAEIDEDSGAIENVIQNEFGGDKVNVTDGETDETREDSSCLNVLMHNDVDTTKTLEQALREERAARAALLVELEQERAAARTAADEAMAMILRLQADKASLEMDAKQYERMMEEKFAYDEEEMIILKEILVRRERENHFLEKELEAYQRTDTQDDEIPEDGFEQHDYPRGHCGSFANIHTSEGREIAQDDLGMSLRAQTHDSFEEGLSFCNAKAETNSHEHGSLPDKEPIVHDVHVVEDKTEVREGKTREYEVNEGSADSVEYDDKESSRMKLMKEILNQLREIVKDHDHISSPSSSSTV